MIDRCPRQFKSTQPLVLEEVYSCTQSTNGKQMHQLHHQGFCDWATGPEDLHGAFQLRLHCICSDTKNTFSAA